MGKKGRQLVLIGMYFLVIFSVFFVGWKYLNKNKADVEMTLKKSGGELNDKQNIIKDINQDIYLLEAKKILDHLDSQKDDYGFYGELRQCFYDNKEKKCDWQLNNNIEAILATKDYDIISKYTTQRYSIPVIWSRFKYYKMSRNQEQLMILYQDIDNLINVLNNEWLDLQTNSFNCLLMREIVESEIIAEEYQKKALKICNENIFEVHPKSLIFHSQNKHKPLVFVNTYDHYNDNDKYGFIRVGRDNSNNQNNITVFNEEEIVIQIEKLINKIAYNQKLDDLEKANVFFDGRNIFAKRENMAVIDRLIAANLNTELGDPLTAAKNKLDYLILLQEVLSYYIEKEDYYPLEAKCLLLENIEYFYNHFAINNSNDVLKKVNNKLEVSEYEKKLLTCFLVKKLLNEKEIVVETIYDDVLRMKKQSVLSNDWPGYFSSLAIDDNIDDGDGGDQYFDVEINAILAGLLAIK